MEIFITNIELNYNEVSTFEDQGIVVRSGIEITSLTVHFNMNANGGRIKDCTFLVPATLLDINTIVAYIKNQFV